MVDGFDLGALHCKSFPAPLTRPVWFHPARRLYRA